MGVTFHGRTEIIGIVINASARGGGDVVGVEWAPDIFAAVDDLEEENDGEGEDVKGQSLSALVAPNYNPLTSTTATADVLIVVEGEGSLSPSLSGLPMLDAPGDISISWQPSLTPLSYYEGDPLKTGKEKYEDDKEKYKGKGRGGPHCTLVDNLTRFHVLRSSNGKTVIGGGK